MPNSRPSANEPAPREHEVRLRARYGETDQMGVVYHPNYLVYFEIGRTEFLRDAGLAYRELEKSGVRLVVTDAGCRYLAPVRYDDALTVRTRIAHLGRVRVRFEYRLLLDGSPAAEGHTELACLDETLRPAPLPQKIMEILREWAPGTRP